jgi:hypothetical protein
MTSLLRNHHGQDGQSLIEWIFLLPIFSLLLLGLAAFAQYFLMRQVLISTVREAGFLYSSGHLRPSEVNSVVRKTLSQNNHSLLPADFILYFGPASGSTEARRFQLDQTMVRCKPGRLIRLFINNEYLEEKCVLKHVPHYNKAVPLPTIQHYELYCEWSSEVQSFGSD